MSGAGNHSEESSAQRRLLELQRTIGSMSLEESLRSVAALRNGLSSLAAATEQANDAQGTYTLGTMY
jgi:hypothetical protein